jgi:hypothetical protein
MGRNGALIEMKGDRGRGMTITKLENTIERMRKKKGRPRKI